MRALFRRPVWLCVVAALAITFLGVAVPAVYASSVTSAVFSGGAGTASVGGVLYAKQGAAVTLTVNTSSDTQCVDVAGAFIGHQQSSTPKSSWTFTTTAGAGDGARAVTATASVKFNNNDICSGASGSAQGSYTLDNTGPVAGASVNPAPSGTWNTSDVTVRWTATDTGVGVAGAQPFRTDSVTTDGIVTVTAPAQADRLGNTGQPGSQVVSLDKTKPTITAAETKNPDGTRTIKFVCNDATSGVASCLADGATTDSRTVPGNVTVSGTAKDKAGNSATTSMTSSPSDTTAPTLKGVPTTQPDGSNGWYKSSVTIQWTCADEAGGSGLATGTCPADDVLSSEAPDQTVTRTIKDVAGNSTTATSSPAVKIDTTAPTTGLSGTSNNWVSGNVVVSLAATDNLSSVDTTTYTVDGGTSQTGSSFTLSTDGDHTVTYFSTDKAGNAETARTAHVKIDQTAPSISHTFTPLTYEDGSWTNKDVTVTFTCSDQGGSSVAGCTSPLTKSAETSAAGETVKGTATDGAGNTASDNATVRIDKTNPTINATLDRQPNAAGWFNDDVAVGFAADDALSGLASKSGDRVLGQGINQSASGTATDAAGNSASDTVTGVNVDKTAPSLSASFPAGWNTGDVTVQWTCADPGGSGVKGTQPADTIVDGEGDNLSATSSCADVAGNTVTETVTGIKIDRTAPVTTGDLSGTQKNGWFSSSVQVTLSAHDNLTDVARTSYTVDGGPQQTYTGAFSVSTNGAHTVEFWSKDGAGNTENAGAPLTLKIDQTSPATTVINPISPDSGWFVTSGIPVAFKATDAGSGIAATYYTVDGGARQTYGP